MDQVCPVWIRYVQYGSGLSSMGPGMSSMRPGMDRGPALLLRHPEASPAFQNTFDLLMIKSMITNIDLSVECWCPV